MKITREQLSAFQSTLISVAHTLPMHVREGVIATIAVQAQNTVGETVQIAAQSIVKRNQGTFDSYLDELTAAGVSGEQLVLMLLFVGINSGNNWAQTFTLFKNA